MKFPSTLKKIEYRAFLDCNKLKLVSFPAGLEYIGRSSFSGTGLESVELPGSLRTICQSAFSLCESLRSVRFNEGLEVLGADEYLEDGKFWYGVF